MRRKPEPDTQAAVSFKRNKERYDVLKLIQLQRKLQVHLLTKKTMSAPSIPQLLLFTCLMSVVCHQAAAQKFLIFATTTQTPPAQGNNVAPTQPTPTSGNPVNLVLVNNEPVQGAMVPFDAATAATPQFLDCFGRCQTTPEYRPICASNRQLYLNEQKFECARACGANIRIVRRGSCEGLFPMHRG